MKLNEILVKVAKGEALTEAEKKFLAEYDAEKATNDAVAAVRRKADDKYQKLQQEKDDLSKQVADIQKQLSAKEDKGKTKEEQLMSQIADLSKQVAGLNDRLESADKANAELARSTAISKLREKAGIKFIKGVSEELMCGAFAGAFDGIEDLSDETVTKPIIERFKESNKAVIADASGHGSGSTPRVGDGSLISAGKNPWKEESYNLTEQSQIYSKDPALAKRLASEAGVEIEE